MSNIYPVIHVQNPEQSSEQALLAMDAQADGVFLIEQNGDSELLVAAYDRVSESLGSTVFIGLNFLEDGPTNAIQALAETTRGDNSTKRMPDGLWIDDIMGRNDDYEAARDELIEMRAIINWHNLEDVVVLGGFAFKQSEHYTDDPEEAAEQVMQLGSLVDVVVSSGSDTGVPIELDKLDAMSEAVGTMEDLELGVASGITIENIGQLASADWLLVASSIETQPWSGQFDEPKLKELITAAHSL